MSFWNKFLDFLEPEAALKQRKKEEQKNPNRYSGGGGTPDWVLVAAAILLFLFIAKACGSCNPPAYGATPPAIEIKIETEQSSPPLLLAVEGCFYATHNDIVSISINI